MKLDLRKPFRTLSGKPSKSDPSMSETLAQAIANMPPPQQGKQLPILKLWGWATKLASTENGGGILELDKEDAKTFEELVTAHPGLTILAKGQLLELLNEAQSAAKN